ncbi:hypothetical protein JCM16303_004261 [Sporobolomyces ruberrimus]
MSTEMKPVPLTLIVAATRSNAIGRDSSLPWRLSKEMAYFARMTKGEQSSSGTVTGNGNAVIMGRKSWEGIPSRFRPLADRVNVVVTRQKDYNLSDSSSSAPPPLTHIAHSLESAVELLRSSPSSTSSSRTFLIGGAQLYNEALLAPSTPSSPYIANRILLTRVLTDYPDCDTFLHPFEKDGHEVWKRSSHRELVDWAGWDVPEGVQREKDRLVKGEDKEVEYEFQMWVRSTESQ